MAFALNYITLLHCHQAIRLMGKKSWIITSKQLSDQYDPLQSYSHILVMKTTTRALQTMRNYRDEVPVNDCLKGPSIFAYGFSQTDKVRLKADPPTHPLKRTQPNENTYTL